MTLRVFFHKSFEEPIYVIDDKPIEYICCGKEGSIYFDGYYYVEDHAPPYPELEKWKRRNDKWLPRIVTMGVGKEDTLNSSNILEYKEYIIEIYKRVIEESTDKISEIEDDGIPMSVCFFPTDKQTIYFRILETIK